FVGEDRINARIPEAARATARGKPADASFATVVGGDHEFEVAVEDLELFVDVRGIGPRGHARIEALVEAVLVAESESQTGGIHELQWPRGARPRHGMHAPARFLGQ